MKEYSKPVIDVVSEAAEGVYAASGKPGCDSKYMNGMFQLPKYNGYEGGTVKDHYGCLGCPAYRNGQNGLYGCALQVDQAYLDGATSYNTDDGFRKPDWEGYQKTVWENGEAVGVITVDITYDISKNGIPY